MLTKSTVAKRYSSLASGLGYLLLLLLVGGGEISKSTVLSSGVLSVSAVSDQPQVEPDPLAQDSVMGVFQTVEALDSTVWKKERLAQEYERAFIRLWDQLRPAEDKYVPLAQFAFESLTIPRVGQTDERDWGIQVTRFDDGFETLTGDQWKGLLGQFKDGGFEIVETEWHQTAFDWTPGSSARSIFSFKIHAHHPESATRYALTGDLIVIWSDQKDGDGVCLAAQLETQNVKVRQRTGPRAFELAGIIDPLKINRRGGRISGVLVYDLDHDGLPEILLPGCNRLLWNEGGFSFRAEKLFHQGGFKSPQQKRLPAAAQTALLADFTSDGRVDLLATEKNRGVRLFPGGPDGRFTQVPQPVEAIVPTELAEPMAMTAGDIDNDGDIDVWIGQWKDPYVGGKPPTRYYDANDSYPSYLLINDGHGRFSDRTEAAGLSAKRHRRTFSASFVDLDEDNDLDLLVVSDFAGVDLYLNDGKGNFTDVSEQMIDVRYNFGMSHTLGDYNRDGALDFYVIGMSSTTARRLDYMKLGPARRSVLTSMRGKMGYGNRMYMAKDEGGFVQPAFNDSVARSGWSWGSTTLDFDCDGDRDIYVANGFWSGNTAKDYCTRFWCHDIYMGSDAPRPAVKSYFEQTRIFPEYSWNPFEKNHLFMNEAGRDFLEVGFLMNVALGFDARQVIGADLDADGRVDLLVGQVVLNQMPQIPSYLHLLRNHWPRDSMHWIGFHLDDRTPRNSPLGARIEVHTKEGVQVDYVVTGDSLQSQHPMTKHFGLGALAQVDAVVVVWPNGKRTEVTQPAVDQYHRLQAP